MNTTILQNSKENGRDNKKSQSLLVENQFLNTILNYARTYQTGCLKVQQMTGKKQSWFLYFRLGRLFWAAGGDQEQRRVYRQLVNHFSKEAPQLLSLAQELSWESPCAYYNFLAYLHRQKKMSMEEFIAMKNYIILEILFDILQTDSITWEWNKNGRPKNYIAVDRKLAQSSEQLVHIAQRNWSKWETANFSNCSPNQAPIMLNKEKIQQATSQKAFQNLERLVTGKQSVRDIAVATKSNILQVTKFLWEYYEKGWLQFQEISDLDCFNPSPKLKSEPSEPVNNPITAAKTPPTIAA